MNNLCDLKNDEKRLQRIYIWGSGPNGKKVLDTLKESKCKILGIVDNNPSKHGIFFEDIPVLAFENVVEDYDYIIVSVKNYVSVLYQLELVKYEKQDKIIVFWDEKYLNQKKYEEFINIDRWRITLLEDKVRKLEELLSCRTNNLGYEIIDRWQSNGFWFPKMGSTEDAINKIVSEECSMIRFGDGEFAIMAGYQRANFQKYEEGLSYRLREVLQCQEDGILIAIANNYGRLDRYTESHADGIRRYMEEDVRKFHQKVLLPDKVYYDAYMFKCYLPHKDKTKTLERVNLVKRIWEKRKVVIIEGDKTRTGCGNDLLANAKTIRRLLAPTRDAWAVYPKILHEALHISKDNLILMALGPAGKVLAYDLIKEGYQVVDIGQIDMDYEWYRAGKEERVPIPNKFVSQLPPTQIKDIRDEEYLSQIIKCIC